MAIMKHRTTIFLEPEQKKKLEAISAKTGAPVAELIRRAIDAYLKAQRGEK
jgi:predicted DNA-binding protein